jgi:hypothetical protein
MPFVNLLSGNSSTATVIQTDELGVQHAFVNLPSTSATTSTVTIIGRTSALLPNADYALEQRSEDALHAWFAQLGSEEEHRHEAENDSDDVAADKGGDITSEAVDAAFATFGRS